MLQTRRTSYHNSVTSQKNWLLDDRKSEKASINGGRVYGYPAVADGYARDGGLDTGIGYGDLLAELHDEACQDDGGV